MIKNIVASCLPLCLAEKGEADLGDRTKYIGASDIGQCPRKVIMGKLFPTIKTIEQQIVFERGHLAEKIVHESLMKFCEGNPSYAVSSQEEVTLQGEDKIKAHIDFVLSSSKKLTVIEVKTSSMVNNPYDSWISQCIFQQGLLRMKNTQQEVDGYVFVLDLKTGANAEFKVEYDENVFDDLVAKARWLLGQLNIADAIDYDSLPLSPSVLCGYCDFKEGCPFYEDKTDTPEDLKGLILAHAQINGQIKELKKALVGTEDEIKSFGPFKVTVDGIKASYTVTQERRLDIAALKKNEPELYEMYSSTNTVGRLVIK